MFPRFVRAAAVLGALLVAAGSAGAEPKKKVACTLPTIEALVHEVGGDKVEAFSLAAGDQDPHFVSPTPSLMKRVREADLLLEIGMQLEMWADEVANGSGNPRIFRGAVGRVALAGGIPKLEVPETLTRAQGDIHPEGNPHLWLDPIRAKMLAANVAAALKKADPEDSAYFDNRLKDFQQRIDRAFFGDLVNATGLLRTEVEKGLGELVAWGLVVSDSFAGLRALLVPSDRRKPIGRLRRRGRSAPFGVETAGRWSRTARRSLLPDEQQAEAVAWMLLRRYGVVFRRLVERETVLVPWRDVLRVYRRLEARGEIRGGRFVGGFSGEQYALSEAVGTLRSVRRQTAAGSLVTVSGADPLNLVGIIVPGDSLPALAGNRVLYRDGEAVAVREGNETRFLAETSAQEQTLLQTALVRQRVAPLVRAYLGKR